MKSHDCIDQRSLAFGRAIAAHLANDPALMDRARATLSKWLVTCSPGVQPALREWLAAMNSGTEAIAALLTGLDQRATRLRQSNPFAGLLPQEERNEILLRFESYDKTAT